MAIMAVCSALLAAGGVAAAGWGRSAFTPPHGPWSRRGRDGPPLCLVRRPGSGRRGHRRRTGDRGRRASRHAAAGRHWRGRCAGTAHRGRSDRRRISVDGTIGFILFNGIFGGIVFSWPYLIMRRFLPPGPLGGAAYGLGLLVVAGTTLDPLRPENPDFDIVGPGWVAVVAFSALAVAFGVALSAVMARLSQWLPLITADRRVLVRYLGPAAVSALAFPVTAALAVTCIVTMVATRFRPLVDVVQIPPLGPRRTGCHTRSDRGHPAPRRLEPGRHRHAVTTASWVSMVGGRWPGRLPRQPAAFLRRRGSR